MEATRVVVRLKVFVLVAATLLVVNDLLPYIGARDDSCQTMFSGLEWFPGHNNHYLAPQIMSTDLWLYLVDVSAQLDPPADELGRAADLMDWLNREDRQKNVEAVRVVVRQLCDRGHRVRLTYRNPHVHDEPRVADACDVPELSAPHSAIPIRLFDSDYAEELLE